MIARFHLSYGHHFQYNWAKVIGEGLASRGWDVRMCKAAPHPETTVAFIWSWRHDYLISEYKRRGVPIVYIENGVVPPKDGKITLSLNGFNGRGKTAPGGNQDMPHILPWQDSGYSLVIAQHPLDKEYHGIDMDFWLLDTVNQVSNPVVRIHPHDSEFLRRVNLGTVPYVQAADIPLATQLAASGTCITYSSNAAVEAVIAGVPTVSFDAGSYAWEVTSHDLTNKYTPRRTEWLRKLMSREYTVIELRSPNCRFYPWLEAQLNNDYEQSEE